MQVIEHTKPTGHVNHPEKPTPQVADDTMEAPKNKNNNDLLRLTIHGRERNEYLRRASTDAIGMV